MTAAHCGYYSAQRTPHSSQQELRLVEESNREISAGQLSTVAMATSEGGATGAGVELGFPQSKLKPQPLRHKGAAIPGVRCQPISGQAGKQLNVHMVSGHHMWGKPWSLTCMGQTLPCWGHYCKGWGE